MLSHVRLFLTPVDCSPPGSSVHGILQALILDWVVIPPSRGLPDTGIEPASFTSPALEGEFFTIRATWEALKFCAMCLVAQ